MAELPTFGRHRAPYRFRGTAIRTRQFGGAWEL